MDDDRSSSAQNLFNIVVRRFSFVRLGQSFRCTEMEAALGVADLELSEANIRMRQRNAACLAAGLADLRGRLQLPAVPPDAEHVFMFYPLNLTDPEVARTI